MREVAMKFRSRLGRTHVNGLEKKFKLTHTSICTWFVDGSTCAEIRYERVFQPHLGTEDHTLAQKLTSGNKQRQQQSHSVIVSIQEAGLYFKSVAGKVDFHDSQQQDGLFVICLFV